jgi:Flp pilus assembly protein TadB
MLDRNPREEVHRITEAGTSLSEDQSGRARRYLWSMGIRTACFVGAVLAPSPWRWFLVVGAIFLPYVAVVVANAGRERSDREGLEVTLRPQRRMLGRGSSS